MSSTPKEIQLFGSEKTALVDAEDYEYVNQFVWRIVTDPISGKEYAGTGDPPLYMHDLIMRRAMAEKN